MHQKKLIKSLFFQINFEWKKNKNSVTTFLHFAKKNFQGSFVYNCRKAVLSPPITLWTCHIENIVFLTRTPIKMREKIWVSSLYRNFFRKKCVNRRYSLRLGDVICLSQTWTSKKILIILLEKCVVFEILYNKKFLKNLVGNLVSRKKHLANLL